MTTNRFEVRRGIPHTSKSRTPKLGTFLRYVRVLKGGLVPHTSTRHPTLMGYEHGVPQKRATAQVYRIATVYDFAPLGDRFSRKDAARLFSGGMVIPPG